MWLRFLRTKPCVFSWSSSVFSNSLFVDALYNIATTNMRLDNLHTVAAKELMKFNQPTNQINSHPSEFHESINYLKDNH